jgi:Peptidase A4 family
VRKNVFAVSVSALACGLAAVAGGAVFSAQAAVPSALAHTQDVPAQRAAARAELVRMLRSAHHPFIASGAASRSGMPASVGRGRHSETWTGSYTGVTKVTSINWSGYGLGDGINGETAKPQQNAFTYVSGTWTVPFTTCNTRELRFDAQWVGLDGLNDTTVEQLGTTAYCYLGKAYYTAWIEMFPAPSEPPENPITVEPGQSITASVTRSAYKYTLTLTDNTTKAHFTQTETVEAYCTGTPNPTAPCPLNASAEWVVERPAFPSPFGFQIVPLAQFRDPITFTTAKASGLGLKDAGPGAFSKTTGVWAINIASSGLNTTTPPAPLYDLDTTSGLRNGFNGFSRSSRSSASSSFSCTWLNSY